jgi:hypothetical protein
VAVTGGVVTDTGGVVTDIGGVVADVAGLVAAAGVSDFFSARKLARSFRI